MSVDTATETVIDQDVTEQTEADTTPSLPIIPDTDEDVRNAEQRHSRIVDLFTVANATPDSADVLIERALTLAVQNAQPANAGPEHSERVLMHAKDDVDPETGRGRSQRFHYPSQRAAIVMNVASAFGVTTHLTYRVYDYAGSRKQYTVQTFGAEQDVRNAIEIARLLDTVELNDLARLEFGPTVSPGAQTKTKRDHVAEFANKIAQLLAKLIDANDTAAKRIAARRSKFVASYDETTQEWITPTA